MKKIINYLSVFTLVLFLSNCDKSSTESTVDPLVGIWEQTEMTMTMGTTVVTVVPDDDNNQTMIFNEDGTFSYTGEIDGEIDTGNGTWSTNSNKLTMIEDGETTVMDYSITGNVVTISITDTSDGETVTVEIKYTKQQLLESTLRKRFRHR